MFTQEELCRKIIEIYPEIGECGLDITVNYDAEKKSWVVEMVKDSHQLKHYMEASDADDCMEGKKCVPLGLEIAQLKKNIQGKQF